MTTDITESSRSVQSSRRWLRRLGVFLVGAVILAGALWFGRGLMEPSYQGKSVRYWFEQALQMTSAQYRGSECEKAFQEMEGDAVPFLVRWIVPQQSASDLRYETIHNKLPQSVRTFFSPPRTLSRSSTAMILIGEIGRKQKFDAWDAATLKKPSVALAIPRIRAVLQSTNSEHTWAVQAVGSIGALAADTVPDLITLLEQSSDKEVNAYSQALGNIGHRASSAAPALAQIAGNEQRPDNVRQFALQALAWLGSEAAPVTPVLARILQRSTNETLRVLSVRAIASMGQTPDDAVAPLKAMLQSTNDWAVTMASLALWNRNHEDHDLRANMEKCLQTDKKGWLLSTLWVLGTNAAPFKEDANLLVSDFDHIVSVFAKRATRAMEGNEP